MLLENEEVSCTYDTARNKPGLKRGTVEKLSRRIEVLERKLLGREKKDGIPLSLSADYETQPHISSHTDNLNGSNTAILSILAEEIQKLSSNILVLSQSALPGLRTPSSLGVAKNDYRTRNGKRQRLDIEHSHPVQSEPASPVLNDELDFSSEFVTGENLEALLDAYFINIHPWIPMIHMATFRRKILEVDGTGGQPLILHAILVGVLRFLDPTGERIPSDRIECEIERSRSKVILMSMNDLSVENLQALIILAFIHIGDGEPLKAWPIVATLTRTVDFLQMSVEDEDDEAPKAFLRPKPLPPPVDWMEEEERRRVFWNIFILDRICSVTTGWNIGLTADNVSRRLPICGTRWNEENPALAPFFGIWDKSAAKIGNSVAFLPAHYPSPGQSAETNGSEYDASALSNQKIRPQVAPMDISTIGAFAYYVESLESLCRINIYFLQQQIDFNNRQEVSNWLTRFKELDLRLVHWKMFLPAKWKDPNVPPEATTALDPNMSLAHITHNTSMILLHQRIGYPERKLKSIKLPNFYSAETCQSAAIETANIAMKYLAHAPPFMPLSAHFSFCAYISARVLLVHCRYYGIDLDPQFSVLVECLQEIARRWMGSQKQGSALPLAAQFAGHLQDLYERYRNEPNFSVSVVGPLDDRRSKSLQREGNLTYHAAPSFQRPHGVNELPNPRVPMVPTTEFATPPHMTHSPASGALGVTLTPGVASSGENGPANWASPSNVSDARASNSSKGPDELSNIIQTLTDQRFMEMDRVISFDDFNFESMSGQLSGIPPTAAGSGWTPDFLQGRTAGGAPR
ncbi:Fc.00g105350.m01.CDS01 [Cosmosporella sp. VM-42]